MIITKTPFRISFAGGGTDLAAFYEQEYGAVVSTTIDKFMYIAIHKFFERKIMLKYSKTELVDSPDEIEHPLIRECMNIANFNDFVEITSFADIPSKGSGLGSSSSFSVGMLKALASYQGKNISPAQAAEQACTVEIEKLGDPIGKQDQYAAAFGGFNYIRFNPDGSVFVEPIIIKPEQKEEINKHLLMFYTGITRKATTILAEQQQNTISSEAKFNNLKKMRDLANELRVELMNGNVHAIGEFLHKGWTYKKDLASGISSGNIDEYYEQARQAGAVGGKILGAGGGGFLLFWCPPEKHEALKKALGDLEHVPIRLEPQGAHIIYTG
ncbi:MAG: GHMP kinase [Candidatus Woesearchaeota archaeon]|nr:GHMP kinase [Candidatus Woesearchaeota archaeon]